MNAVLKSALARLASFVPIAIATLLTSRLVIDHYGIGAFDSYALILSLINLIPLNNLGVGAAVTSAYAAKDSDGGHAQRTLLTAARVLSVSTAATAAASLALSAADLWPTLLGGASGPNLWCGVAMALYALTFLPGLGQSMLLGVHRNHLTILVQTFYNPVILALVALAIVNDAPGKIIMTLPCVALLIINIVTSGLAAPLTRTSWRKVLARLPRRRRFPGASIRALSGPVLIVTLSTPIALQSDRIVLSHVSTSQAVADYSIAFQIFSPALALVAASAQPLWPIYTRARSQGRPGPHILRVMTVFCGAGLLLGAALAVVADPVAHLIGGKQVHVSVGLAVTGALAVLTAAASYPVAMSLMYPQGLRFVVWSTLLALPVNIGLSVVLGSRYGAPGPLLASVIAGIFVQALPGLIFSRDRQGAGRHRTPDRQAPHRLAQLETEAPAEPGVAGLPVPAAALQRGE